MTATFDSAARTLLELLLAAGGTGSTTTLGKRAPTVYSLAIPGIRGSFAAALETLAAGRVDFTLADSDESLSWPSAPAMPRRRRRARKPPLMRVAGDMAGWPSWGRSSTSGATGSRCLDLLARLRRVDGDLAADGDLFRLTLHSALKQ